MNTRLLRAVQRRILKEPKQFQMRVLYSKTLIGVKIPNCGTAACIAGWTHAIAFKKTPAKAIAFRHRGWLGACITIEISPSEGNRLFFFGFWPQQFRRATKEGTAAFAKQAARRIDHFIKTNGAE